LKPVNGQSFKTSKSERKSEKPEKSAALHSQFLNNSSVTKLIHIFSILSLSPRKANAFYVTLPKSVTPHSDETPCRSSRFRVGG
jgi:hypothetical protein